MGKGSWLRQIECWVMCWLLIKAMHKWSTSDVESACIYRGSWEARRWKVQAHAHHLLRVEAWKDAKRVQGVRPWISPEKIINHTFAFAHEEKERGVAPRAGSVTVPDKFDGSRLFISYLDLLFLTNFQIATINQRCLREIRKIKKTEDLVKINIILIFIVTWGCVVK